MIIDGRAIAAEILAATRGRVAALGRTPVVRAIVISPTPATQSYLRIKSARAMDAGMQLEVVWLPESATTEEVTAAIGEGESDAVIVQLPLPASIDFHMVCDAIPINKDADCLSRVSRSAEGAHLQHRECKD